MRMKIRGLNQPDERKPLPEGPYLARVVRFEVAGHAADSGRSATFLILDPGPYSGSQGRSNLSSGFENSLWVAAELSVQQLETRRDRPEWAVGGDGDGEDACEVGRGEVV